MKYPGKLGMHLAILLGAVSGANAGIQLKLSDGNPANTVIVADQSPADADGTVGSVVYIGPVGANWVVNVSSGLTKPAFGNALVPHMDLSSVNSSVGPGVLTIEISDTDFIANGSADIHVGGNTDGTVEIRSYADAGNTLFGKSSLIGSVGPLGPGAFNGSTSGTVAVGSPYSLTLQAIVTHTAAGQSGFDDELGIIPSEHGGCRVTGGSNKQTNTWQSACITTALPTHVSHGGQVGAPFSVATPFTPNSACIRGEWQHNRHLVGNSLVGVLHAAGNGNVHQFDSVLCACLPCPEDPGAVGVVGGVCNPGQRICGPEPRRAPANKICFSGVGDYTFTTGNKTVKAVFRVDIEDRSEGNSDAGAPPPDRYRIRIWLLDPACGRNPDPDSVEAMQIRFAASADETKIGSLATTEDLKVNITPDIDDGGNMTQGNHQIHPQTGAQCDAVATITPAHIDTITEIAAAQVSPLSFGFTAIGLQTTTSPSFVYRTTITNVGWVAISNLSVLTADNGTAVDSTGQYFASGAVLPPGGTLTRYYTNVWSSDTISSILVSGTSVQDGTPAFTSGSTMAIVALAGPTGLSARVSGKKVTLSWNALSGASSYNIKRATTSGGPYVTIKTGQTSRSYSDNGLASGTYYYVVSGVKSGAETLNSSQVSATIR